MALPKPVEQLWAELQTVRGQVLREAEGLSQGQVDWKPSERDWSVGEIIDHLTIAEIATGKLTTKLTREAEAAGGLAPFPDELSVFAAVPAGPPGPAEAPPVVWPSYGKSIGDLITAMKATRERSRQSVERLGGPSIRVP